MAEIARVLSREGFFLISTPNREAFGQKNPYHLHEFTRGEFTETLKKYFKNIFILEQTNGIASLIKAGESVFVPPSGTMAGKPAFAPATADKAGKIYFPPPAGGSIKPLYFIAVASNNDWKLSELFKESVVSVNPAALKKLRNNPVIRMADWIYSLFKKFIE